MKLPIRIWDVAHAELEDGVSWYEERQLGLGERFANAVIFQLDRISRQPTMHAKVRGEVRRSVLRDFPYSIFYIVESTEVVVISIFHASRDPSIWQDRADNA